MPEASTSKSILLVEDEALIAMNEAAILEKWGYEVTTAHNALEAIETVRESDMDLILMDIDLGRGKMDGTEAAEKILAEREIPIVFLSSHTEKEMVERVKGITRYGYVLKTAGEFVLIESITMAFELFESHVLLKRENEERRRTEDYLKQRNEFIETIIDNIPIGLAINYIDEGKAVYMNRQFERIYGWPKEELTDIENFFRRVYPDPDYRDEIKRRVFSDISTGDPERMRWEDIEITTREGEKRRITATNIPLYDQNFMISTVQDVTELGEALSEANRLELFFYSTLNGLPSHIALLDTDGNITLVNNAWRDFAEANGVSPHAVSEGVNYLEVCDKAEGFSSENARAFGEGIRAVLRGSSDRFSLEYPCHSPDVERWFVGRIAPLKIEERNYAVVSHQAITEQKFIERDLREKEGEYRLLAENSHDCIGSFTPDFDLVYLSPSSLGMFGYSFEELRGGRIFDIVHPEDRPLLEEKIRDSIREKADNRKTSYRIITKAGEVKWIEVTANYFYDTDNNLQRIIVNARDITDRKDMEDELRRTEHLLRAIIECSNDIIVFKDTDFVYRIVNSAMARLVGKSREELLGKTDFDVFPPDQAEGYRAQDRRVLESREPLIRDETVEGVSGTLWVNTVKSPVLDRNGTCLGVIVAVRDITDRKNAEAGIRDALGEKDDLMKELNHRVKNNLIMVKSLINLKDSSLGAAVDLSDLARQIDAIRIVHEKLYQSSDVTHISVREYIEDLLSTVFSFSTRPVEVEKRIEPEYLHSRTAVTIGLLVNEIATNAIKHGFTEETKARFAVELREDRGKGTYTLVLSNNGRNFPPDIDINNPETLGLRLLTALTHQLGGTIELEREPSPVFTIRFPVQE